MLRLYAKVGPTRPCTFAPPPAHLQNGDLSNALSAVMDALRSAAGLRDSRVGVLRAQLARIFYRLVAAHGLAKGIPVCGKASPPTVMVASEVLPSTDKDGLFAGLVAAARQWGVMGVDY